MTPPDGGSEEYRIRKLMCQGPSDDEKDIIENFDEWLEDEVKGLPSLPDSTTPSETLHG